MKPTAGFNGIDNDFFFFFTKVDGRYMVICFMISHIYVRVCMRERHTHIPFNFIKGEGRKESSNPVKLIRNSTL